MTAGAAQILLKQSGLVPQRAVLAGVRAATLSAGQPDDRRRRAAVGAGRDKFDARCVCSGVEAEAKCHHRELPETGREDAGRHQKGRRAALPCGARYTGRRRGTAKAITFSCGARAHRIECDYVLLHQGLCRTLRSLAALVWTTAGTCSNAVSALLRTAGAKPAKRFMWPVTAAELVGRGWRNCKEGLLRFMQRRAWV
jgi:hypothetical protein